MTNQERQDYQFYDQNKIKEEIQNQNQVQKQGKKGGYSKNFKEGTQRGNQNIIDSGFYLEPSEILVEGEAKPSCKKSWHFKKI